MTQARIHRISGPKFICPWGLKALHILKKKRFQIEDIRLASKEEAEAFKAENGFTETPQIYLDAKHIGGYDQLREHLGLRPDPDDRETYIPVIAVFITTILMALVTAHLVRYSPDFMDIAELFISFSMCVLGILKLQNLPSFVTGFLRYDILAQRYVSYAYIYPFIEVGAGILMIANLAPFISAPIVLVASSIGAYSVFKAVYIDKRSLSCACVGGSSNVPLGPISLTENLMMIAMAIWMLIKHL